MHKAHPWILFGLQVALKGMEADFCWHNNKDTTHSTSALKAVWGNNKHVFRSFKYFCQNLLKRSRNAFFFVNSALSLSRAGKIWVGIFCCYGLQSGLNIKFCWRLAFRMVSVGIWAGFLRDDVDRCMSWRINGYGSVRKMDCWRWWRCDIMRTPLWCDLLVGEIMAWRQVISFRDRKKDELNKNHKQRLIWLNWLWQNIIERQKG